MKSFGPLLRGLRSECDLTSEIIRGMGKTLSEGIALLINEEATILAQENSEKVTGNALITNFNPHNRRKVRCHFCKKWGDK